MEVNRYLVTCTEPTFGMGILALGSTVFDPALLTCLCSPNNCYVLFNPFLVKREGHLVKSLSKSIIYKSINSHAFKLKI